MSLYGLHCNSGYVGFEGRGKGDKEGPVSPELCSHRHTRIRTHVHTYTHTAPYVFLKCNFPLGPRTVRFGCVHGYGPHVAVKSKHGGNGTAQLMSRGNAQKALPISDPSSDERWVPLQFLTWLNNILWPECSIDLRVQVSLSLSFHPHPTPPHGECSLGEQVYLCLNLTPV